MRILATVAILALAGCASAAPLATLPKINAEDRAVAGTTPGAPRRPIELNHGVEDLQIQDQRVADIAFRISVANSDLCQDRRALSGLKLHTPSQYSKAVMATLAERFPRPQPAVLAVADGSPAHKAGLSPYDLLLAVNGKTFDEAPVGARPTIDDTKAASDLLSSALTYGRRTTLRVLRGGRELDLTLDPVLGCPYTVDLEPVSQLSALQSLLLIGPRASRGMDQGSVVISERMAAYAIDDSELAFVIGHEYAHNLLQHPASLGPSGEAEADYVGLYLAARSGFDIAKVVPFWIQLSRDFPDDPISHSRASTRIARLAAAAREIDAKRALGQPLVPNLAAR